jgi:hypothetical protein
MRQAPAMMPNLRHQLVKPGVKRVCKEVCKAIREPAAEQKLQARRVQAAHTAGLEGC